MRLLQLIAFMTALSGVAGVSRAADAPAGALSCSGCHPDGKGVDTPVPRLVGRPGAEIVSAMQAFRAGQKPGTIMDRVARGFGDNDVAAIAGWYAARRD